MSDNVRPTRYRYLILWYGPWDGARATGGADTRAPEACRERRRYMVVPLDEARQPEEFTLRASYTACTEELR